MVSWIVQHTENSFNSKKLGSFLGDLLILDPLLNPLRFYGSLATYRNTNLPPLRGALIFYSSDGNILTLRKILTAEL